MIRLDRVTSVLLLSAASSLGCAQRIPEVTPQRDDPVADPAQILSQAIHDFFQAEDMPAAERGFRAVLQQPKANADEKNQALFYLWAALGRLELFRDAILVLVRGLAKYPNDKARHYVLLFKGDYLNRLGNAKAGRACWEQIVKEAPQSDMAEHARRHLGMETTIEAAPPAADAAPAASPRVVPADTGRPGKYVVVPVGLDGVDAESRAFADVARSAVEFHRGVLAPFDGRDFDALRDELRRLDARNVLFVLRPEMLDVNLHRRILLLSATLDDDMFTDFAFGYFTARDGKTLKKLWERTAALHKQGLSSRTWTSSAVTSGMKSTVYADFVPAIAKAAGFAGSSSYFASITSDPDVMQFVEQHLPDLEKAAVIEMTGCGDPQGIWLFDDSRNADRQKHWPFDPAKVGYDPNGEMPRITADRFAQLKLANPIVWSGTCHCAATRRVFVEGDIVSTFGTTDKTTVYELKPDESLCLAMIDAGAAAFLAPIAANHGMSVSREADFALAHGASLGETLKSTYDDVILGARGAPRLAIQEAHRPQKHDGQIMQGGGANRILIGDPALAPFRPTPHPEESVEVQKNPDGSFDVIIAWKEGFHSWAWDMFGTDRQRDWGIVTRIPLDEIVPAGRSARLTVTMSAKDDAGHSLPYTLAYAEPEVYHGKRYLHLRANGPRTAVAAVERKAVRATFHVVAE